MPKKRQTPILDPRGKASAQLTTLSYGYVDGYIVPDHIHREDQLVFAERGVMTVRTPQGIWVVPPLRAVWVPADKIHSISMSGQVQMRTLYFARKVTSSIKRKCFVINVTPLLRELIIHTCGRPEWRSKVSSEDKTIEFIVDQLHEAETIPLQLSHPTDSRAIRLVELLLKNPTDSRTTEELCLASGGSKRTIERAFVTETGITLGKWRQQLRLLHAMRMLACGEKVTTASLEAGYQSPSAFISLFKKSFGETPAKYFRKPITLKRHLAT